MHENRSRPMAKSETVSNFSSHQRAILDIWDKMQTWQCDFCVGQELPVFFRSERWRAAASAIDIGAGNGHYLKYLATYFPYKKFDGVDLVPELVDIARQRVNMENVSFFQGDLAELDGTYDAVILRLVVQHLADAQAILDGVCRVVQPGGAIFIVDACDALRMFSPTCAPFLDFFQKYAQYQLSLGLDRNVLERIKLHIGTRTDIRIVNQDRLLIPSSIRGNFELMHKNYDMFTHLVEMSGGLSYDYEGLRDAWRDWGSQPGAYTQVGLDVIELAYEG